MGERRVFQEDVDGVTTTLRLVPPGSMTIYAEDGRPIPIPKWSVVWTDGAGRKHRDVAVEEPEERPS